MKENHIDRYYFRYTFLVLVKYLTLLLDARVLIFRREIIELVNKIQQRELEDKSELNNLTQKNRIKIIKNTSKMLHNTK